MENNNLYVYFVEGQDEKKLVEILKTELNVIYPGKVYVFNVTTELITRARLMQIKPGTVVVLIFDTDVGNTTILDENIKALQKCPNVSSVVTIPQVRNLEDELVRSCEIKDITELLDSSGVKKFKADFIKEKNLTRKMLEKGFDVIKLWKGMPTGNFKNVKNQADEIRVKNHDLSDIRRRVGADEHRYYY